MARLRHLSCGPRVNLNQISFVKFDALESVFAGKIVTYRLVV